jgi:hypothetical protein
METKVLILLSLIYLVGCQTTGLPNNTYTDNAPSSCSLTQSAQARLNSSSCFSGLKNIIACMPPSEQDLWAYSNAQNSNSTRCFDCSLIKGSLKNSTKQNINSLANKMTDSANNKRKALSCLATFSKAQMTTSDQAAINSSLTTIVASQKKSAQAQAILLQNVGNVFIARRRFLCMSNTARAQLISKNDTVTNSADGFIYNTNEAAIVVNNFLSFFQNQLTVMSSLANEISSMTDVVANSVNCKNSTISRLLRYLQVNSGKSNGKALGNDISNAVSNISNSLIALNTTGAKSAAGLLTAAFSGNTLNCQANGFTNFLSNLNLTGSNKSEINSLGKFGNCTQNFVSIIQNNQITCEGSCKAGYPITLSFIDSTKVPSTYYFASGCAGSQRFIFATWSDLNTPSTIYSSLRTKEINSDSRCLKKIAGCIPGGNLNGGDSNDGGCSNSNISKTCADGLNKRCTATGLPGQVTAPPSGLPSACDAISLGLDPSSASFISSCFTFIATTYFKKSMIFSADSLVSDATLALNAPTRLLQDASINLVDPSQDTSLTQADTTFTDVTLATTDVTVDGSTPTSVGSTSSGLNDVNSQPDTGSVNFISVPFIYIFAIAFVVLVA